MAALLLKEVQIKLKFDHFLGLPRNESIFTSKYRNRLAAFVYVFLLRFL